jgi:hypothetical protein
VYPIIGHCAVQAGVDFHDDCSDGGARCSSQTCAPPDAGHLGGPPDEHTLCSFGACDSDLRGTGPVHCAQADAGVFVCPDHAGTPFACAAGYGCNAQLGICKTSCSSIGDCTTGYVCDPSGACVLSSSAFPPAPSGCSLSASPVEDGPWGRLGLWMVPALVAAARCRRRAGGTRRERPGRGRLTSPVLFAATPGLAARYDF